MSLYINQKSNYLIQPSKQNLTNCKFLVAVHSRPDAHEARMGIRNSWGQYVQTLTNESQTSIIYIVTYSMGNLLPLHVRAFSFRNGSHAVPFYGVLGPFIFTVVSFKKRPAITRVVSYDMDSCPFYTSDCFSSLLII